MQWPWSKAEPAIEKRESYTDALVSAILSSRGESAALAQDTAVAEIAAGQLGRTLSSGTIQPKSPMLRGMITPAMLNTVGYELIKNGECCFWISPDGSLVPASYWDINGSYNPKTWQYRLDLSGPSHNGTVTANSKDVLSFKFRSDTIRPWRGIGPLQGAGLTSKLVSGLERLLGNETSAELFVANSRIFRFRRRSGPSAQGRSRQVEGQNHAARNLLKCLWRGQAGSATA